VVAPAAAAPAPARAALPEELQRFVESRGISFGPEAQRESDAFAAEVRDPAWSPAMEAGVIDELSRSTLALADWYVECRRTRCMVVLVAGTIGQPRQAELPNGAVVREGRRIAETLNLLGIRAYRLEARYDTLVTLLPLHRRCGPECDEASD
jgi:hypothetical protein